MTELKQIDILINKEIEEHHIAGASVCLIHDYEEFYRKNYGLADIEKKVAIDNDTIFRLYSMGKPIATVAAMILFERGQLDLSSNVSEYLPGFKSQKVVTDNGLVPVNRDVTILDLFSMTSGLVYPDPDPAGKYMDELFTKVQDNIKQNEFISTFDLCNKIGKQPLAHQPGTKWRYGTSTDVLGAIIEVISGMRLGEFYAKEIFSPLGMSDSGFYVPRDKQNRFAELYEHKFIDGKSELDPATDRHLCLTKCLTPPVFESAGAGVVSTIGDYAKFAMMLTHDGTYQKTKILGRKTVELMTQNQLTKELFQDYQWEHLAGHGYGFFQRILMDQTKAGTNASLGEFGWDGWSGTYVTIDRKEKFVMLYMVQNCGYSNWPLLRKIRALANGYLD